MSHVKLFVNIFFNPLCTKKWKWLYASARLAFRLSLPLITFQFHTLVVSLSENIKSKKEKWHITFSIKALHFQNIPAAKFIPLHFYVRALYKHQYCLSHPVYTIKELFFSSNNLTVNVHLYLIKKIEFILQIEKQKLINSLISPPPLFLLSHYVGN